MEFLLFLYFIIILSAVFHEFLHAWTADQLGDPTAKHLGRLTLNPLKHMDLFGTVLLPLFLLFTVGGFIGYAKPVPYNPLNLRDKKYGDTKVAFAGPVGNFLLAVLFAPFVRFAPLEGAFVLAITWIIYINIFLGLFNLIPIPPLDGSKLLMNLFPRSRFAIMQFSFVGVFLAIMFAIIFLPGLASLIYYGLTGQAFLPVRF
ncbi:MAG: site-2 protease family protein [Candidatus Yanofskybacteria bacterium]|nr:site-2 protease family protein [Candidatus Yanofskybacteria bacterium]